MHKTNMPRHEPGCRHNFDGLGMVASPVLSDGLPIAVHPHSFTDSPQAATNTCQGSTCLADLSALRLSEWRDELRVRTKECLQGGTVLVIVLSIVARSIQACFWPSGRSPMPQVRTSVLPSLRIAVVMVQRSHMNWKHPIQPYACTRALTVSTVC